MESTIINNYLNILKEELVLALGCTEPISIAYCAAKAREVLGEHPEHLIVRVSGNILKNAMGVIIPNTTNLRGAKAAAVIGAIAGNSENKLEVLKDVTESDIKHTIELLKTDFAMLETVETKAKLFVEITAISNNHYTTVELKHTHTNIVRIEKDNELIQYTKCSDEDFNTPLTSRELLNIKDIFEFANTCNIDDIKEKIKMQLDLNYAIAIKGLTHDYGLNVGSTLIKYMEGQDIVRKAKAYTAAGSDARMSGSTMPVVTICGSGNQGITSSVPLIVLSEHLKTGEEILYRAAILSDLIAIHIKTHLGRLSAFCGAVVAGTGAACGITYLYGGNLKQIEDTIKNMLANISGVFCDGAKPSCAAKIASSIDAAFQASLLALDGHTVESNSGIISNNIEDTILNVGEIAYSAMVETDKKIIEIMARSK